MGHHAVDCVKVFLALIVQLLRLRLQLLEPSFRIDIDCIFSILAQVEFRLERLRRLVFCQ
jgi:hypothetical protein